MQVPTRAASLLATVLVVATTFLSLIAAPAAATTGRDSPSAAADCTTGPWEGLYDLGSYVDNNPVSEDYYRCPVYPGQILQVSLWGPQGMYGTINRNVNGTLVELTRDYTSNVRNVGGTAIGMAELDYYVYTGESLYIKVSPPGMPANTRFYYNIYIRTVNLTVLEAGGSFSPAADENAIHGWDYPSGFYFFGENYVSDFYLINASDLSGGNHRNYRVTLTQTCATAMFDIFVYQWLDYSHQRLDILNHSYSMERRLNRAATTTIAPTFDFSPALYDGYYLLRVRAAENGTYDAANSAVRYRYTVSVNTVGGYAKDGNDRPGEGPSFDISGEYSNHIDTRDDPVDWVNLNLLARDTASISVSFTRPNSQDFTNLGLRYRAIIIAPNGTIIDDVDNWGFTGMGFPFYNPYLTVPSFTVYENGTYRVGLFTADASLDTAMQRENSGGLGRNSVDYRMNFGLPNRAPVVSPLPDMQFPEDTVGTLQLSSFVVDPERKPGYPLCGLGTGSANLTTRMQGCLLSVTPKADWNGVEWINVTFSDDFPGNKVTVMVKVNVSAVNDAPRIKAGASAFSTIHVPEDGSTTVAMRDIFEDVDSPVVTFTTGGVSGTKVNVSINDVSQIATITPNLNFNGQILMSWFATDEAFQVTEFPSTLIVDALNDPPRATDTRLPRIVFDEGRDYLINLTSHFFDTDATDSLRYYGAVDQSVSDFIRVNNSNLNPSDPNMRVYVVDQYRSDYFTNGPIPIRFWVLDAKNNLDESSGQTLAVEKSTFLEIVNVNDAPIVDEVSPLPEEVAIESYEEGASITFAVTRVKDPDNTFYPGTDAQFFYKWFVNDNEIIGQTGPTYVFRTVLDATQAGQWDAGNYSVYVQVYDAAGAKAAQEPAWNFEVSKKNREPSVQVVKPTTTNLQVEEGTPISFKALVSDDDPEDAENLLVTWRITGDDGRERILGTGDELQEQLDPGSYRVRVTVNDGDTEEVREFRVTVTPHAFNTPGFEAAGAAVALIGAAAVAVLAGRERRRN